MKIERIPLNADEYKAVRDTLAVTAEGGAALFICALSLYAGNPEEGMKCLILSRNISDLEKREGAGSYMGYALGRSEHDRIKSQLAYHPYLFSSYFSGATPENNYEIPAGPVEIVFSTNPYSGDEASGNVKLFVNCSGADSPRPIAMSRNDKGIWKAKEYSSLYVGIKKRKIDTVDKL